MPLEYLIPDAVFQATHLIVFLPPCLGAFVLSNHSSHNSAFFKFSSPDAPANEGPTACVKQVANFPLPSLLPNQSDTLIKARADFFPSFSQSNARDPTRSVQIARAWKHLESQPEAAKETETGEQENKAEKTAGNTSETRRAKLRNQISRAKIRQSVVKRHIHSKYAPKTCIPSISKRPNQMTEGENQTN